MNAGFDQTLIELKRPYYTAGFTRPTKTDVVSEPLFVTSSVFQHDQKTLVLCVIDCVMVDKNFTQKLKKELYITLGLAKDDVIIAATHTHSAPAFIHMNLPFPEYDEEFLKEVHAQCIKSIKQALDQVEPVEVSFSIDTISGIYGNRNDKEFHSDKSVYTFKFTNNNEVKGIFMNISCHPTIINQSVNELSSDLIGGLRRNLREQYHAPVCISNGACGDTSTRFYRQGTGSSEVQRCSQAIIDQLSQAFTPCNLHLKNKCQISLQSYLNVKDDPYARHHLATLLSKKELDANDQFMLDNYIYRLTCNSFYHELDTYVYDLGACYLVTIPGELVSALGQRIKDSFPDDPIIIIAYANDYVCYLVNQEEYGAYFESKLAETPIGIADTLCQKIVTSIHNLKEEYQR